MIVVKASVAFTTQLELNAVAALISDQLFGGVAFVTTDEFDEDPGVRLQREILGFTPTIHGSGPGYGINLTTEMPICEPDQFPPLDYIYLTKYLEERLSKIPVISIIVRL